MRVWQCCTKVEGQKFPAPSGVQILSPWDEQYEAQALDQQRTKWTASGIGFHNLTLFQGVVWAAHASCPRLRMLALFPTLSPSLPASCLWTEDLSFHGPPRPYTSGTASVNWPRHASVRAGLTASAFSLARFIETHRTLGAAFGEACESRLLCSFLFYVPPPSFASSSNFSNCLL